MTVFSLSFLPNEFWQSATRDLLLHTGHIKSTRFLNCSKEPQKGHFTFIKSSILVLPFHYNHLITKSTPHHRVLLIT